MIIRKKSFLLSLCATTLLAGACDDGQDLDLGDASGDKSDSVVVRIDRVGRPEITNFTIRAPEFKAGYNAENSFRVSDAMAPTYAALLGAGVQAWDALDGEESWPADKLQAFVGLLVADYLVVDISKPCDVDSKSYMSIERSLALGTSYDDCGGRTPNDDIVDTYTTYLVGGFDASTRVRDGIDEPADPATNTFPYLAQPLGAN